MDDLKLLIAKNSATPFGVGEMCVNYRRLKRTAIHVKPYRANAIYANKKLS